MEFVFASDKKWRGFVSKDTGSLLVCFAAQRDKEKRGTMVFPHGRESIFPASDSNFVNNSEHAHSNARTSPMTPPGDIVATLSAFPFTDGTGYAFQSK